MVAYIIPVVRVYGGYQHTMVAYIMAVDCVMIINLTPMVAYASWRLCVIYDLSTHLW
jgi:hypothetical protein